MSTEADAERGVDMDEVRRHMRARDHLNDGRAWDEQWRDVYSELADDVPGLVAELERLRQREAALQRLRADHYVLWQEAGGPNECSHGYAHGIPCPRCDAALAQAEPSRIESAVPGSHDRPPHPPNRTQEPSRATDHPYAGRSQSDVCLVCGRPRDRHAQPGEADVPG